MAKITKSANRIGRFTRSADSAPPPVTADIRRPGDFRDGVRKALAQGQGARGFPRAAPDARDRDGDGDYTVIPARSVAELQHQLGQLIAAFVLAKNREPTACDSGFWAAYAELVQAYEKNEKLGPEESITEEEPLAKATPVRKVGATRDAIYKIISG